MLLFEKKVRGHCSREHRAVDRHIGQLQELNIRALDYRTATLSTLAAISPMFMLHMCAGWE